LFSVLEAIREGEAGVAQNLRVTRQLRVSESSAVVHSRTTKNQSNHWFSRCLHPNGVT